MGLSHPRYVSWAAQDGRVDDLVFHLTHGGKGALRSAVSSSNPKRHSPLHLAAMGGHDRCIRVLIEAGSGLDRLNRDGHTPLHLATFHQHSYCVQLLLQLGAKPAAATRFGVTPLHLAAAVGNGPIAETLVQQGAAIDSQESWGQTPLAIATQKSRLDCMKRLLRMGADTEVKDYEHGYTALHVSCTTGDEECVLVLLDAGADLSAVERNGLSAVGVALTHRFYRILPLLVEFGARPNDADCQLMSPALWTHLEQEISSPFSLQRCCRVAVRRSLGPHRMKHLTELQLPQQLVEVTANILELCEGAALKAKALQCSANVVNPVLVEGNPL